MKRPIQKFIIGAAALLQAVTGCADVYASGICPGSYAYYPEHVIGPPSFKVGYQGYLYSTDTNGSVIVFYFGRKSQPGEIEHCDTRIFLGPWSFSAPMRPPAAGACAGLLLAGLLALGNLASATVKRRGATRTATHRNSAPE